MRQKSGPVKEPAEKVVKDIRRATRRQFSAEEKIRIVLEGLRGEESIAELCRREGIVQNLYYRWSKAGITLQWRAALARSKPNSCIKLATRPGRLPGTICSLTSKDITIDSGSIPPSGISPPNWQSAKPLDPVSTKSGEGHCEIAMDDLYS